MTKLSTATFTLTPLSFRAWIFRVHFPRVAETLLSTSFCAAAALACGRVDMSELQAFDNPAIMSLVRKMALVADREFVFPACTLKARLRSGQTIVHEERTTVRDYDLTTGIFLELLETLKDFDLDLAASFEYQSLSGAPRNRFSHRLNKDCDLWLKRKTTRLRTKTRTSSPSWKIRSV